MLKDQIDSVARSCRFNVIVVFGHLLWSIGRLKGFKLGVCLFNGLDLCFTVIDGRPFICNAFAIMLRFQPNLLASGIELYINTSQAGDGPHRQIRRILIGDRHQLFAVTVC
ncbi:hypothetical protein D3C76_1337310 [compost metagenome]